MPHVTQAEARIVAEAVHKQVGYLFRLRERMEKAGRKGDPLYPLVCQAHDAAHSLWVSLHYRGCGIDRPPSEGDGSAAPDANTGGS